MEALLINFMIGIVCRGSLEPGLAALFSVCSQTLTSISFDECNLMITERYIN